MWETEVGGCFLLRGGSALKCGRLGPTEVGGSVLETGGD